MKKNIDIHLSLFNALSELLSQKSIENITVNEILQLSNTSRTTFYKYFKDKYDLMCWYYDHIARENHLYSYMLDAPWENTLPIYSSIYEKNSNFFKSIASYNGQNSFQEYLYNYCVSYFRDRAIKRNIDPYNKELDIAIQCFSIGLSSITIKWLTGELNLTREEFDLFRSKCYPVILTEILK